MFPSRTWKAVAWFSPLLATVILIGSYVGLFHYPATGNNIIQPVEIQPVEIQPVEIQPVEIQPGNVPDHAAHLDKSSFFALMKPILNAENIRVLHVRQRLLKLKLSAHLRAQAKVWLKQISTEYRVPLKGKPDGNFWNQILSRVDIVPLEMALAQAANESAWGNSRFAREANNYFGQWCLQKGCGIVPLRRNVGAQHEVKRFDSPASSVRAYIKNMNTLQAYEQFRNIRQSMRHQGKALDAEVLVAGLRQYSERGDEYIKIIRSMIRKNRALMQKS